MLGRFGRRSRLLRLYRREFGAPYAALTVVRWMIDLALLPLDDYLLRVEGSRAALGPAHRAYRGQGQLENRELWSAYDWSNGGEEWGPPESRVALIEQELTPRLREQPVIVEIGPGAGRWSADLQRLASRLVLVDVSDQAVKLCRRRFASAANVEVLRTEGASLPDVAHDSVDAVWSMEAFVHMAPATVAGYAGEIARVLKPGGVAIIHHAGRRFRAGWRAPMTGALFARLAHDQGLAVERQFDTWGEGRYNVRASHDVISVLRAPSGPQ